MISRKAEPFRNNRNNSFVKNDPKCGEKKIGCEHGLTSMYSVILNTNDSSISSTVILNIPSGTPPVRVYITKNPGSKHLLRPGDGIRPKIICWEVLRGGEETVEAVN